MFQSPAVELLPVPAAARALPLQTQGVLMTRGLPLRHRRALPVVRMAQAAHAALNGYQISQCRLVNRKRRHDGVTRASHILASRSVLRFIFSAP